MLLSLPEKGNKLHIPELNKSQTTTAVRPKTESGPQPAVQVPATESVQPSDQASIGSVASAVSQGFAASEARVAELRNQYQSGAYRVSAQEISSKLIDEHLSK